VDRVFLDANILFSVAYQRQSGLRRLWELANVELLTSSYAAEEARRNLADRYQRGRLTRLLRSVMLVTEPENLPLPPGIDLPEKDRPIFLAALEGKATHLLTGDVTHFGSYYGRNVEGIVISSPAEYLAKKALDLHQSED
jgi:uncharacterized protein